MGNFGLTNGYTQRLNKLNGKSLQGQSNPAIGSMCGLMRITMTSIKAKNECRRTRARLLSAMSSRFGPDTDWLQKHISKCLRCLRRLVSRGKVNLALSFMKTKTHRLDLLMRANAQAIGVLKHCLRQAPRARQLRTVLPEPKLLERCGKYRHSAANLAACIAILLLMMIGVFSSMDKLHTEAQKVIEQHYARQVGQDLADEIFPVIDNFSKLKFWRH